MIYLLSDAGSAQVSPNPIIARHQADATQLSAIDGLPLDPSENGVQGVKRFIAQANPWQVPVPFQMLHDITLILGCADFRYA
jgi:hypothetical protein